MAAGDLESRRGSGFFVRELPAPSAPGSTRPASARTRLNVACLSEPGVFRFLATELERG